MAHYQQTQPPESSLKVGVKVSELASLAEEIEANSDRHPTLRREQTSGVLTALHEPSMRPGL